MDFHFPYHENFEREPDKASLPHPQQAVLCMRVHSPLVGVCDPSLTFRHLVPYELPVGSTALQVGSPSDYCEG